MEAMYYEKVKEGGLRCRLCPHNCIIQEGKAGICKVRRNTGGILVAETWGKLSAINIDPVEKKTALSLSSGEKHSFLGQCRLQYEMPVLSELADFTDISS
jgi:pyruvate formate lyase activating enzyme